MKTTTGSKRTATIAVLVCLFLACFTAHGLAEEQHNATQAKAQAAAGEQPSMVLTMKLYDGVIKCPFPLWVKEAKQIGESKMFRNQKKNIFSFEMVPKSQEFSSWTRLYGVYGLYLPEYDMKRFFDESMNALALGCKGQSKARILSAENNTITLEYYCPELRPEIVTDGNTVERAFMYISHTGKTFAKVYQAWRGSDNSTESEDWPSNPAVQQQAVESMKAIRFYPANPK